MSPVAVGGGLRSDFWDWMGLIDTFVYVITCAQCANSRKNATSLFDT